MEGTYPLCLGAEALGQVRVKKQGLYYEYACKCQPFSETMYDVYVQWGTDSRKLGLLVPQDGWLCLRGRIPVKQAGQGSASFVLRPRHCPVTEHFVPLHPQEPFAYLQRLENAYLAARGAEMGVILQVETMCKKM